MARLKNSSLQTLATFRLLSGSLSADEDWAPFGRAQIVIAKPSAAVMALLDPATRVSVELELAADDSALAVWNGTSLFRLALVGTEVNDAEGTVSLSLMSAEQYLQDYKLPSTTEDLAAWGQQSSLRSIVYNVLNRVLGPSFTASYDALDTPFITYSEMTNLIENPSFEIANAAGWTAGNAAIERSDSWAATGTFSGRINPTGSTNDTYTATQPGMSAGQQYSISATFRMGETPGGMINSRARRIVIVATVNGTGRVIAQSDAGPSARFTNGRVRTTFTVPATASNVEVRLYNGSGRANDVVYWDAILLVAGNGLDTNNVSLIPYFDGNTTNTSAYAYKWDGDANASTSTRVPVTERPPESLTWSPGQSAYDFLKGILDAANQRLFCDLDGTFILTNNDYRDRSDVVHFDYGANLYSANELRSRTATQPDGTPLFADGVLITYTWRDRNGIDRKRTDYAGPTNPQSVYPIERTSTGYPGKTAAAYLLVRLRAKRVMQEVTAAEDFDLMPGREVSITSAPDVTRTGYVTAVTWDLSTAEMTVTTKGLVNTPVNAWNQQPAQKTWTSLPTGTTWATYTTS
ncbi:hypothetical protein [Frigoribacterium faeni]|nr:hypothetical protein [Frigoribacterium faeni]